MPIPDYQTLMLPVLKQAAISETRVPEVAERIADELGLSNDEREQLLPSGRQRLLHNRIHWAKFYMSKAGLIASPARGRFIATEAGRKLLASKPSRIDVELLMKEPSFQEFYESSKPTSNDLDKSLGNGGVLELKGTPEEQIEVAYQSVQSALRLTRFGLWPVSGALKPTRSPESTSWYSEPIALAGRASARTNGGRSYMWPPPITSSASPVAG